MGDDVISRRRWVVAAGLAGLGAAATQARAADRKATLSGPYLDVTAPEGARRGQARLAGNFAPKGRRYDWFDGQVIAVAANGSVTPLFKVRGHIETHFSDTFSLHRRLFATYYDAKSGQTLAEFRNPLTGALVKVAHINGATSESQLAAGQWRQAGANFEVQHSEAVDFGAVSGLSVTTHTGTLADLQDATLTTVPDSGSWTLITAWLPWLQMGNTAGHCVFQCTRTGGAELRPTF